MINDISMYLKYLNQNGFAVTCHFFDSFFFHPSIVPYNYHRSPYCLYVKSCREAWDGCLACQNRIEEKLRTVESFSYYFGVCHAGVGEFVFPIRCENGLTVGFVSVSGYDPSHSRFDARRTRTSKRYGLSDTILEELWKKEMKPLPDTHESLLAVIKPLLYMLTQFCDSKDKSRKNLINTESDTAFLAITRYLEEHFSDSVSLDTICVEFNYSRSYISHLFKKKSGQGIKGYLNALRIERAKELLVSTELPIGDIASIVGYSDSNYFTNLFHKLCKMSPRSYRKQFRI